ncbi:MAG: GAF domain-containing protein [Candidatus Methanomethylicia archaeon]|nr:GAF domain-containing protein [Candidatus Methanomethylicia archaeon]MDW7988487.1 GAF domain-containing protein [Nitrososphaerota archaeon]
MDKNEIYRKCHNEIMSRIKRDMSIEEKMDLICDVMKKNIPYYFWVGFYLPREDYLELGPSRGPPACARIAYTGVCGTAYKRKQTIIVPDVDKFPGHIVCDPRSKSEIAVPVFNPKGEVIAIFDVDSDKLESFDETDKIWLEEILGKIFQKVKT